MIMLSWGPKSLAVSLVLPTILNVFAISLNNSNINVTIVNDTYNVCVFVVIVQVTNLFCFPCFL